ncbi:protease modulator HflC [Candidatus Aquarickettsia rohweri]|uniref:Protein HflC n=1 Tax=Candidatus Aquarickettsia rohweri TaxID=2602574 RepID=A0A429XR19_9RICK|nr:protease modulator HflC [Candidatus Aquarickettsia rohweri]MSO13978.1 Protein HflC [Rickettsiales endosymbiont of Trichoplax sp. H2]RST69234.1 protease modulator HflC [Candidatus Aquarickettsia rohweri]
MKKIKGSLLIILLIVVFLLANSLYILDQRKTAIIIQFGEVIGEQLEPGLKFKLPLIQEVRFFDKRIQTLTFKMSENSEVVAFDQKTMKVDAFAKYKITNPKQFYETMYDDSKFRMRLESIIESGIREVIGRVKFIEILGSKRNKIREGIIDIVNKNINNFGVDAIDVRLIRVNLPDKARKAVYERMITDRQKEAKEIRAIGHQESDIIKAKSDREKTIIIAEANKSAEIIKGQGDAEAISLYAKAYGKDRDFYEFYKSLEVYKNSLDKNSSLVMSSDNKFLKYLNN